MEPMSDPRHRAQTWAPMVAARRIRDPLGSVSVKTKLTLTFIGIGLVAFGIGGTLAWNSAKSALEEALLERMELQATTWASSLEAELVTLTRRVEDFASDGHIRTLTAELLDQPPPPRHDELLAELSQHLLENKLPLESAFVDLTLVAPDGGVLYAVHQAPTDELAREAVLAPPPWYGPLSTSTAPDAPLRMAIATPLVSLDGRRELGRLLAWVNPGPWISRSISAHEFGRGKLGLSLVDRFGHRLRVPATWMGADAPSADSELVQQGFGLQVDDPRSGPASDPGQLARSFAIAGGTWRAEVVLDPRPGLEAIAGLQSRFLAVGALLALVCSGLLFFPLRFLARPLAELIRAARSMQEGNLSVRVPVDSEDEIGALGGAFNSMAAAIEERTGRLERAAADLQAQRRAAGQERDRLRAVISSMRDGLVVLDHEGQAVLSNDAAAPLLRMIEDHSIPQLTTRHRCEANQLGRDCVRCLLGPDQGARSCLIEFGGATYEVHATRLGQTVPGQSAGRVLVSREVTDRIAQDERHIHQERLAVLGEVAAVFAHELNNPLAAIRMYNQLLEAALPGDSNLREHVEVIGRNTDTCSRTIRELLDYATGAAPEIGPVSIPALLEDVATFLRPMLERSGVELCLDLALEPGSGELTGDEIQLRQIFVNLLMNAIQALNGGGHVTLRVASHEAHLAVEVEDDGPGIPGAQAESVFRPFFTTKLRGEGTGLGLSTARRIAELHGGGLELVESRPGCTRFRVRLQRKLEVSA
jgi:signal transduction histidine kinase